MEENITVTAVDGVTVRALVQKRVSALFELSYTGATVSLGCVPTFCRNLEENHAFLYFTDFHYNDTKRLPS